MLFGAGLAHQGAPGCQALGGVLSVAAMFRNKALKLLPPATWPILQEGYFGRFRRTQVAELTMPLLSLSIKDGPAWNQYKLH